MIMKRTLTTLVLLLAGIMPCFAQMTPHLYWRFANASVVEMENDLFLEFDVQISCDQTATYHSDLQVYLDYNTDAFGENVVAEGNIFVEKLELLDGMVGDTYLYVSYPPSTPGADNQNFRHAYLTESQLQVPNSLFMHEVPMIPEWAGLAKYRIRIQDPSGTAGIRFVEESTIGVPLMNTGQYYLNATNTMPVKYGQPGQYVNDLIDFPLMLTDLPENADPTLLRVYAFKDVVYVQTGSEEPVTVTVYDLPGKVLVRKELAGGNQYEIPLNAGTGVYVVETAYNDKVTTKKVFIEN